MAASEASLLVELHSISSELHVQDSIRCITAVISQVAGRQNSFG